MSDILSKIAATYRQMKARDPECLFLFKIPRYEAFYMLGDDARRGKMIAETTDWGMTIDPRDGSDPLPIVTFPINALEPVLSAIVAQGGRAAVCEQVGAAPKGTKIERVVTPGRADG